MKLKRIHLKKINQFQHLDIDLTYPNGHEKSGQPLDKICFIGQSGTGKTTLLNIIKEAARSNIKDSHNSVYSVFNPSGEAYGKFELEHKKFRYVSEFLNDDPFEEQLTQKWSGFSLNGVPVEWDKQTEEILLFNKSFFKKAINIVSFPVSFKFNNNKNPDANPARGYGMLSGDRRYYRTLDFSYHNIKFLWQEIIDVLQSYKEIITAKLYEISLQDDPLVRENLFIEFKKWEKENPNFIKDLGESYLNPILEKFQLKIVEDLNVETLQNYEFIPVKHIHQEIGFNFNLLSSASQSIIYTATALKWYDPKEGIVLIDEIENSLYPDVQKSIVNDYIAIAPSNQFFFATHSPIIASSFDPWEIVELKFDENGNVYQDQYLKDPAGGRHIGNYKFYPKYLSWDENLMSIFDLNSDGPEEREARKKRMLYLEEKLKFLKAKGEKIPDDLLEEFKLIGQMLGWKYEENR